MMFKRRIVIEKTQMSGAPLHEFPAFISLADPWLKGMAHGGHVRDVEGRDIHFVDADGASLLPYEIEIFDGPGGKLEAWVRLPIVSETADTVFYMVYGGEFEDGPVVPTTASRRKLRPLPTSPSQGEEVKGSPPYEGGVRGGSRFPPTCTRVWDAPCVAMLRPAVDGGQHTGPHHFDRQLTVEAWVRGDDERAEVLQSLASKWRPRLSFDAFDGVDAGRTD